MRISGIYHADLSTQLVSIPNAASNSDTDEALGSYTFAKTLEYKAKQNLNSGREVTVIPPNEYRDRFVNAINGYFLSCPGIQFL